MKKPLVHLALFAVSLIFGVSYIVGKEVLKYVKPATWAFCRATGAAVLLLILMGPTLIKTATKKDFLIIAALGLFGVGINQIAFFEGLSRTTATHAAVINTIVPIVVLFFSILIGYEELSKRRILGLILSFTGVLILLEIEKLQFDGALFWGDVLTVLNSLSFSFYLVLSRNINRRLKPLAVTAGMFTVGAIGISFYGATDVAQVVWSQIPLLIYALMIYLITFGTIGTYYLNNWALSQVDSSLVALYIYIQPIVAGLLSRWLYHETLTARTILASLMVFSGVAIGTMTLPHKKRGKNA